MRRCQIRVDFADQLMKKNPATTWHWISHIFWCQNHPLQYGHKFQLGIYLVAMVLTYLKKIFWVDIFNTWYIKCIYQVLKISTQNIFSKIHQHHGKNINIKLKLVLETKIQIWHKMVTWHFWFNDMFQNLNRANIRVLV